MEQLSKIFLDFFWVLMFTIGCFVIPNHLLPSASIRVGFVCLKIAGILAEIRLIFSGQLS
jgi:hypothetical protein